MAERRGSAAGRGANRRGAARLLAVQAIYQMEVGDATLPGVIAEFEAHRLESELEGEKRRPADRDFFRSLVGGVVELQRRIDPIINDALPNTWPLTRIDLTLRAVLRCGVFELLERRDVPARVVITEYVDVANAFFGGDEPGLVNGVLDHVAHDLRPDDFSRAASG